MDRADSDRLVAPFLTGMPERAGQRMLERRWEGHVTPKPWQRKVTATFAHLETPELVRVVIDLLRAQTVNPHVIIVDTGSSWETCARLEEMRTPEVEIHYVRSHAYRHPSAPVSAACDLAMSLCTSEWMFMTHVDCFLRRRDFMERLVAQCDQATPVVGYRMSDRSFLGTTEWKWMVSHTATMLHMPTVRAAGCIWAIEAAHDVYGAERQPKPGGWPDTETAFNLALRRASIVPTFIGDETNYERHLDDEVDHCRSFPGSALYSEQYHAEAQRWIDVALDEARERADRWAAGVPDPPPGEDGLPPAEARTMQAAFVARHPSFLRELVVRIPVGYGSPVTVEQGGGLAPLWTDTTGARMSPNPVLSLDGEVRCFAERGTFRVSYKDRNGKAATVTVRNG